MEVALVFDIGGTSFRAGILGNNMELLEHGKFESPNYLKSNGLSLFQLQQKTVQAICSIYEIYRDQGYNITKVGIGFPGPINKKGEVMKAPTLWGPMDSSFPLYKTLSDLIPHVHITIINDLTAAGWRYIDQYNGTFCVITVSSGIGNKVFWKGNALLSDSGYGGELGHAFYDNKYCDNICDCGSKGHIGSVASGRGIEQIVSRHISMGDPLFNESIFHNQVSISTYDIVLGLKGGDLFCDMIMKEGTLPVAKSIQFIYSIIGIEHFVIIGGFACSVGQPYINYVVEHLLEMGVFGKKSREICNMVTLGEHDDLNGLYGMGKYLLLNNSKELIL